MNKYINFKILCNYIEYNMIKIMFIKYRNFISNYIENNLNN